MSSYIKCKSQNIIYHNIKTHTHETIQFTTKSAQVLSHSNKSPAAASLVFSQSIEYTQWDGIPANVCINLPPCRLHQRESVSSAWRAGGGRGLCAKAAAHWPAEGPAVHGWQQLKAPIGQKY